MTVRRGHKLLAYIPNPDTEPCKSLMCRRQPTEDDPVGDCIGWHCGVCGEPSSQYGHARCHEEAKP